MMRHLLRVVMGGIWLANMLTRGIAVAVDCVHGLSSRLSSRA